MQQQTEIEFEYPNIPAESELISDGNLVVIHVGSDGELETIREEQQWLSAIKRR